MKKQISKLAFRKETLSRLEGVMAGFGATMTIGTTSLIVTTMGGGGGDNGPFHDTVYRTEPVEVNDTVIRY